MARNDSPIQNETDARALVSFIRGYLLDTMETDFISGNVNVTFSGCNVWITGVHGKRASAFLREFGARYSSKRNAWYIRADYENAQDVRKVRI